MAVIEFVVSFTMVAFNLAVVTMSIWLDKLVIYTKLDSGSLEQCRLFI